VAETVQHVTAGGSGRCHDCLQMRHHARRSHF